MRGALTFGGLVAFLEYTARAFLPIRDLGAKYTVMQAAMVSAERIFGLLDTAPAIASPSPARGRPARPSRCRRPRRRSSSADVWFAYEGEQWVLRDCSFSVARGEQVALVGPTGEGKTTIVRLMTRAYDVTRGQVLVEGRDVREWDLTELRRHVGLVPQEVFLWSGTVEANLRLGRDGRGERGGGARPRSARPMRDGSSTRCPAGSAPRSASAASTCRRASASSWPSRARSSIILASSRSTRPRRASIRSPRR